MEEESKNNDRTWEEETYWKHFHSVNFFQILPHDFHHHLILPKKFTDNLKSSLPEKVVLKGPNGVSWNVDLEKGDNDVMLKGEGWKEFVKAYSLKNMDIMVFKYIRSECFEVLLFDRSNFCEKEASYFVKRCQHPERGDGCIAKGKRSSSEVFTDRSQEDDAEDCTPRNKHKCNNGRRTSKELSSGRAAPTRDGFHEGELDEPRTPSEEITISEEEDSLAVVNTPKIAARAGSRGVPSNSSRKWKQNVAEPSMGKRKRTSDGYFCYKSNRRPVTEVEKENAVKMATEKASKCENSFTVVMRPTSVYKRFFMSIPVEWQWRRVFRIGQEVILHVQDKTWVCRFCVNNKTGGFQRGWKKFSRDNLLEEFDVCLFVPTEQREGKFVFNVTIFRVLSEVVPPSLVPCT